MFNKLLANLPFNPSLIHQFAFYGKRLKQESAIRRIGFGFITLAFFVQLFAVLSPPQSTLLASPNNDLIVGGLVSKQTAIDACTKNDEPQAPNYGIILSNYGISCQNVAAASTVSIRSTDYNRQLFSMGRQPYGLAGETQATINKTVYYWRYLWGWDKYTTSNYTALKVVNNSGTVFFILFSCGNLVSIGLPKPPVLVPLKTTVPGYPANQSSVSPGQRIGYRIYFNNTGGTASQVTLTDFLPDFTNSPSLGSGGANTFSVINNNAAVWTWTSVPANAQNYYVGLFVTVNNNTPDGAVFCNTATLQSSSSPPVTSNPICFNVHHSPTPPPPTPSTPPCPEDNSIPITSPQCKPCTKSQAQFDAISCLVPTKSAANLTQNIQDANGTTAQPGDVIQYTLHLKNTGKIDVSKYTIQENIGDVLDYAVIQDKGGSKLDANNNLIWPAQTIPAGKTVNKVFTVKVKNPIPQTPQSQDDPGHFDHVMTNTFGNTININVPSPVVETVAQTTQALPNTGPGSGFIIAFAIMLVAGYFFARSRLLAKEAVLVRHDAAEMGGIS